MIVQQLSSKALPASDSRKLVGESPAMLAVRDIATSVARRLSTVLILGETGSGKEMLARHIHAHSNRRDNPFVPVDCSSVADTLFESQLFGHLKGAFTGAMRESLGFVRAADGGTLFLDEIGELSLPLQAKLLRMLQERCVVPVGDTRARPVNIRVLAATNRDLTQMVRAGTFREDLYFRLNVVVLHMPPLRQREQDITTLARHFLNVQAELYDETPRVLGEQVSQILHRYPWPGNVRELANVIEHAHILASDRGTIVPEDLPEHIRSRGRDTAPAQSGSDLVLSNVVRRTITQALVRTRYRKAPAARLLGINVQRLRRLMERLDVREPRLG